MNRPVLCPRFFSALLALGMCLLPASIATADILDLSGATVNQSSIHGGNVGAFQGLHVFDNNPDTRWASEFPNTAQWVSVDLGIDHTLNSLVIDWETANATDYTIRTRTGAQGFSADPNDWTVAATITGHAGLPGGGAKGDDDTIDFVLGTINLLPAGGAGTIDVAHPVGQYLMIHTTNYATTCCNGASIWEVDVDGDPIPEPTSIVLAAMGLAGLGFFGSRRRRSRS